MNEYLNFLDAFDRRLELEKAIITIPGSPQMRGAGFGRRTSLSEQARGYTASAWAFRCVRVLGNASASMPWQLIKDKEIVDEENPAHEAMVFVNEKDDFTRIIGRTYQDMNVYGFGMWGFEEVGGKLIRYWRIPASQVTPNRQSEEILDFTWTRGAEQIILAPEQVAYFPFYGAADENDPDAPMRVVIDKARTEQSMDKTSSSHFENYGIPPFMISSDLGVQAKDLKRYKGWWEKLFQGPVQRWRAAWAGGGLKPYRLRAPVKDLAYEELKLTNRMEICGAFGVPMTVAGAVETAFKATWRQAMSVMHYLNVNPDHEGMAGEINTKITPLLFDQPTFRFAPENLEILQDDREVKSDRIIAEYQAGLIDLPTAVKELGYTKEQGGDGVGVEGKVNKKGEERKLQRKIDRVERDGGDVEKMVFNSDILSNVEIERKIEERTWNKTE